MKLIRPPKDFKTVADFEAELPDVDRRLSPVREFGQWIESYAPNGPFYDVRYIEHTHELIEVNQESGAVRVLAMFDSADELDLVMQGWQESGTIRWLRDRLERAVPRYVCGNCVSRGRVPDMSFDPDARCRTCRHRMTVDPEHESKRLRHPARRAS